MLFTAMPFRIHYLTQIPLFTANNQDNVPLFFSVMEPNLYLLIADGQVHEVLAILEKEPSLAAVQDDNGYSLVHAAASYNELNLLRMLIQHYKVNVDIRDSDHETPLFFVETLSAAKILVEELGANPLATGLRGLTAAQAIQSDGDFSNIALYLHKKEIQARNIEESSRNPSNIILVPDGLNMDHIMTGKAKFAELD